MKFNTRVNVIGGIAIAGIVALGIKGIKSANRYENRSENINTHIESYMADRPQSEFQDIRRIYWTLETRQSALDSLAYREIFMETHAASDSVLLNEFNKVASSTRGREGYTNLTKMMTHKEFKQLENESRDFWGFRDGLARQFKADSVAYRRFFEKHGLLNDSTRKKFTDIAKKIRP